MKAILLVLVHILATFAISQMSTEKSQPGYATSTRVDFVGDIMEIEKNVTFSNVTQTDFEPNPRGTKHDQTGAYGHQTLNPFDQVPGLNFETADAKIPAGSSTEAIKYGETVKEEHDNHQGQYAYGPHLFPGQSPQVVFPDNPKYSAVDYSGNGQQIAYENDPKVHGYSTLNHGDVNHGYVEPVKFGKPPDAGMTHHPVPYHTAIDGPTKPKTVVYVTHQMTRTRKFPYHFYQDHYYPENGDDFAFPLFTPSPRKRNEPNIVLSKLRVVDLPIEHKLAGHELDNDTCAQRSICEWIATGDSQISNFIKTVLRNIVSSLPDRTVGKADLHQIFESAREKNCTLFVCETGGNDT